MPRSSPPQSAGPVVDEMASVERMLEHFEELETQLQQVREGLTHSHRLATLGTIASIVAHEYNNILTPLISYAQMALAQPDDQALMKKAVEKALSSAERAAKISSSLLGFAREADQQHVARLPQIVEEALTCLARDPRKDGIDLTVDVPDVLLAIPPINLEQVLVNLVLNARQAMGHRGGRIALRATTRGRLLQLDVSDTGPGIPLEIKDRLFEPFVTHRPDRPMERDERKGTGLGLCICRDLIRNAGGSITFTSEQGKGTTFQITLPIADDLFAHPD